MTTRARQEVRQATAGAVLRAAHQATAEAAQASHPAHQAEAQAVTAAAEAAVAAVHAAAVVAEEPDDRNNSYI